MGTFTFSNDIKELKQSNLLSNSIVRVDCITNKQTLDLDKYKYGTFYIEEGENGINTLRVFSNEMWKGDTIVVKPIQAYYCPYIPGTVFKTNEEYGIGFVDVPYQPGDGDHHFVFTASMNGCEFAAFYLNETHFRVYHIQSPGTNGRDEMLEWIKNHMTNDEKADADENVGKLLTSLAYEDYAMNETGDLVGEFRSSVERGDIPHFHTLVFLHHMNGSWWFISQLQLVKMKMMPNNLAPNKDEIRNSGHVAVKKLTQRNIQIEQEEFDGLEENDGDEEIEELIANFVLELEAI